MLGRLVVVVNLVLSGVLAALGPPTKVCCLLHHVGHLDLVELVRDVDVFLEAILQELLEGLLLVAAVCVVDDVVVVLLQLQLEVRNHRPVVREVYLLHAAVV